MMTDLSNINYRKCMLNNPMQTLDLLKRKYCMNLQPMQSIVQSREFDDGERSLHL